MNVYRFAPSPTGYLHVGGARTAIFNWLLAKKFHGKFLVRIEDTDEKRSSSVYTRQIINSLQWLGLDWDEELYFQANRKKRYLEIANQLLNSNKAYYCFCSPEELTQKRKIAEENKDDYVYDKTCLGLSLQKIKSNLTENIPYTIRLKTGKEKIVFQDKIMGEISDAENLIGDFILVRSDGIPVYQLAVVVDDHDMGITDVVRGADHLMNTPKQILLFEALEWKIPQYAHLPLILGADKKRLSKRHGATAVEEFKDNGILPQALLNYLCLLGWSPGDDNEIFTKNQLIKEFNLKKVNKSNAVFDHKKLVWMNAKYISEMSANSLLKLSQEYAFHKNKLHKNDMDALEKLAELVKIRAESITDFDKRMNFYYTDPTSYNEKGIRKYFDDFGCDYLIKIQKRLYSLDIYKKEEIEKIIRQLAEELQISAAKIIHPLRLALTGDIASPGIFEIIEILGKEKVHHRIDNAIEFMQSYKSKTNK